MNHCQSKRLIYDLSLYFHIYYDLMCDSILYCSIVKNTAIIVIIILLLFEFRYKYTWERWWIYIYIECLCVNVNDPTLRHRSSLLLVYINLCLSAYIYIYMVNEAIFDANVGGGGSYCGCRRLSLIGHSHRILM